MAAPVAVAVVSWNTQELLERCLVSLRDAGEVHVVDNGSTDGSPAMVRERFPWVTLHEPGENLGFGPAVNLVAAATSTPWIAPSNADIALQPGALGALLAAGEADPRAGILAPRLVHPDGATQHSLYAFPTLPMTLAFNLGLQRVVPGLGDRLCLVGQTDHDRPRVVDWAVGAFLVVRREAWDAAGGFAPDQWMYAEDLDLGWRVGRAGWHTRYVPDAMVLHDESAAARQAFGDDGRADRWNAATYDWMRRRRGALRTRATAAVAVGGALARVAWMTPLARRNPARWSGPLAANRRWASRHMVGVRGHPRG